MAMLSLWGCVLAAIACQAGSAPAAAAPDASAARAPAAPRAAPDARAASPAPEPPAAKASPPAPLPARLPTAPTPEMMQLLASGAWPIERFLDPARGVSIVSHYEAGGVKDVRRLCGDDLRRGASEIRDDLAAAAEDAKEFGWQCSSAPPSCSVNPGEMRGYGARYLFSRAGRGLVLTAILHLESGALDTTAQERFARRALREAAAHDCHRR
jgi:hypothetical protein